MEPKLRRLLTYETPDGASPFEIWLDELQDLQARAILRTRLDRLALGLFGDHHDVGQGVWELRINYGPGYRVYYGEWKGFVILILLGGTKRGQNRDIRMAQKYFSEFRRRNA
jgi:putative addiction module killer protein